MEDIGIEIANAHVPMSFVAASKNPSKMTCLASIDQCLCADIIVAY